MNKTEHLLTVLGEEGSEVAKECSKALRFGLDDKLTLDPAGPRGTEGPTNRDKIVAELNDLYGVVRMLVRRGILPRNWQSKARQDRKIRRVNAYMKYAERVGALATLKIMRAPRTKREKDFCDRHRLVFICE